MYKEIQVSSVNDVIVKIILVNT